MTKRLLLHYPILNMGGAERSSLRMMRALADRGWEITLVLTTGGGALEPMVDHRVKIVRLRPFSAGNRFKAAHGPVARARAFPDLVAYLAARTIGAVRARTLRRQQYAAAATLLQGLETGFIRRSVRADRRFHWIRNDVSRLADADRIIRHLSQADGDIDGYICVSRAARASLVDALPQVAAKAHVVHNLVEADEMRAKAANAKDPFPPRVGSERRILTVCRLSEDSKALLRLADICADLRDRGHEFRWFVLGDGPDGDVLRCRIEALNLQDTLILPGRVENPFPWYSNADLIAVVSYFEGLCGVINEAKIIGAPVLSTRVSGVEEQLRHGASGWIVDNDRDAILDGLDRLLSDDETRAALRNHDLAPAILDDDAKLDALEALFLGHTGGAAT